MFTRVKTTGPTNSRSNKATIDLHNILINIPITVLLQFHTI
ncbi:hypothetical protein BMETH_217_2 [methanotrophic bacterial endosymbiont of Bathymodiolus sp.]|nr:hypothetical protein BMETH_217_2 [methanotrophic bacterial endosymbiont of Bathymodiolus sp.]